MRTTGDRRAGSSNRMQSTRAPRPGVHFARCEGCGRRLNAVAAGQGMRFPSLSVRRQHSYAGDDARRTPAQKSFRSQTITSRDNPPNPGKRSPRNAHRRANVRAASVRALDHRPSCPAQPPRNLCVTAEGADWCGRFFNDRRRDVPVRHDAHVVRRVAAAALQQTGDGSAAFLKNPAQNTDRIGTAIESRETRRMHAHGGRVGKPGATIPFEKTPGLDASGGHVAPSMTRAGRRSCRMNSESQRSRGTTRARGRLRVQ